MPILDRQHPWPGTCSGAVVGGRHTDVLPSVREQDIGFYHIRIANADIRGRRIANPAERGNGGFWIFQQ